MLFIVNSPFNDPSIAYRVVNFVLGLTERGHNVSIIQYNELEKLSAEEIDSLIKPHKQIIFFRPCFPANSQCFQHIYKQKDRYDLYASYDDPTFIMPFLLDWYDACKVRNLNHLNQGFRQNKFAFELFDNFIASTAGMAELILKERPDVNIVVAKNFIPVKTYDHCQAFLSKQRKKSVIIPQSGIFHSDSFEKMVKCYSQIFTHTGYNFYLLEEFSSAKAVGDAFARFDKKTYTDLCCYISEFQLAVAPTFNKKICHSKSNIKLLECMVSGTHLVATDIPSMIEEKDCPLLTLVTDEGDWYDKILEALELSQSHKVDFDAREYLTQLEQTQIDNMAEIIEG